jgi:LysR family transcriptional activator of nhaA
MAGQGAGLICAPAEIEKELVARYGLGVIGRARDLRARFYAIVLERRVQLPALAAILDRARGRAVL